MCVYICIYMLDFEQSFLAGNVAPRPYGPLLMFFWVVFVCAAFSYSMINNICSDPASGLLALFLAIVNICSDPESGGRR